MEGTQLTAHTRHGRHIAHSACQRGRHTSPWPMPGTEGTQPIARARHGGHSSSQPTPGVEGTAAHGQCKAWKKQQPTVSAAHGTHHPQRAKRSSSFEAWSQPSVLPCPSPLSPFLFHTELQVPAKAIRQEKKQKHPNWKGGSETGSVCRSHGLYIENPEGVTTNLSGRRQVAGCKNRQSEISSVCRCEP